MSVAPRRFLGASLAIPLAVAALLCSASPARANGRYPAAGQIVSDPSDPDRLFVRTTFGLLSTRDRGGAWSWICEEAIGFSGFEDPMIGVLGDGTAIAALSKGLSATRDGGCGWDLAGGELAGRWIIDLSVDRADPSKAVVLVASRDETTAGAEVWESGDSGRSWSRAGSPLPAGFLPLTLDTAPSDPSRVYVSGRFGDTENTGAIVRSSDRGETWERLDVPETDAQRLPYLSAVSPADADVIYVRVDGDPSDRLLVSTDGAQTFVEAFSSDGALRGFALSPDGGVVVVGVVGGDQDGVHRAPAGTLAFEKVSDVGALCLSWTEDGLYACADEYEDLFTVGVSSDEGKTWSRLLSRFDLCGPVACAGDTEVGTVCPAAWRIAMVTVGVDPCVEPDAGAARLTPRAAEGGGCGCRLDGGDDGGAASLALFYGAGAALAGVVVGRARTARMRRRRSVLGRVRSGKLR